MYAHLQHFHLHSRHSIQNPFAHLRVSILTNWVIVFSSAEKGGPRIDIPLIKDSVDSDSEEFAIRGYNGLVSVKNELAVAIRRHADLLLR